MFSFDLCAYKHCNKPVVFCASEDNLDTSYEKRLFSSYCYEHCKNPEEVHRFVADYIAQHDVIVGLSVSGMHFKDSDFSGTFADVHAEQCKIRISIFDFSIFSDCNMTGSNIQFSSFAGAAFSHALFTNSELVHNNFNGITAVQSSFDDSDLYNSRFIRATLSQTSFRNCNIKRVCFYESVQDNISFKLSNTREALFSPETSAEIYQ